MCPECFTRPAANALAAAWPAVLFFTPSEPAWSETRRGLRVLDHEVRYLEATSPGSHVSARWKEAAYAS